MSLFKRLEDNIQMNPDKNSSQQKIKQLWFVVCAHHCDVNIPNAISSCQCDVTMCLNMKWGINAPVGTQADPSQFQHYRSEAQDVDSSLKDAIMSNIIVLFIFFQIFYYAVRRKHIGICKKLVSQRNGL